MKEDHENRPLWVCPNGVVYMEASSTLYNEAYDFLVAISEPVSRPEHIHKYKLTTTSLLAAVSIGLNTELILRTLNKFSKTPLPDVVKNFITECTMTYGKTKLVLRKGQYYVESHEEEILKTLLKNPVIKNARTRENKNDAATKQDTFTEMNAMRDDDEWLKLLMSNLDDEDDEDEEEEALQRHGQNGLSMKDAERLTALQARKVQAFTIDKEKYKDVRKEAMEMSIPLIEEYDFHNDTESPSLQIQLKPNTRVRHSRKFYSLTSRNRNGWTVYSKRRPQLNYHRFEAIRNVP